MLPSFPAGWLSVVGQNSFRVNYTLALEIIPFVSATSYRRDLPRAPASPEQFADAIWGRALNSFNAVSSYRQGAFGAFSGINKYDKSRANERRYHFRLRAPKWAEQREASVVVMKMSFGKFAFISFSERNWAAGHESSFEEAGDCVKALTHVRSLLSCWY